MNYFVKTPWCLKKIYPNRIWNIDTEHKTVYLSFDDGPHPVATTFVLDELKKHHSKASFFCIGKNVLDYPEIYKRILEEGHAVGNHTQQHLNGWKTDDDLYLADINEASKHIQSNLFRPPYGRIKSSQAKKIKDYKIVMWDVLSGDFDETIDEKKCLNNVLNNVRSGSIIVFHDSEKAFSKLKYVLPVLLKFLSENKFRMEKIEE